MLVEDYDGFEFDVLTPGSEIVLLTDASSHDPELVDEVIRKAREKQVCISFYLSYTDWPEYYRISEQTGGTVVDTIDRSVFSRFTEEHDCGKCARFYDLLISDISVCDPPVIGNRKKKQARSPSPSTEQTCHSFTTSLLTTQLTVYGNTSEPEMIITDPNEHETLVTTNIEGEKVYRKSFPVAGVWSVCVKNGTLTISIEKTDEINSLLQFIKPVEDSSELTLSYIPPPACK